MADANNDTASETAGTKAAVNADAASDTAQVTTSQTTVQNEKDEKSAKNASAKDEAKSETAHTSDDADLSEDVKSTVDALLDAKALDSKHAPSNVKNLMNREKDNNRRVQDTIKNAKTNPKWFVPLFVSLLLIGLAWVIVYYATSQSGTGYPIPTIGNWNLLIGFLIMLAGFIMTMWWN